MSTTTTPFDAVVAACPTSPVLPPSRHSNPFATCWTRPGAVAYCFPANQDADRFVAQLEKADWRGAIVGPHGSGKSTLLENVKPALVAAARSVHTVTLQDGQRRLPTGFLAADLPPRTVLVIDGYEQLNWLEKACVARHCRRHGHGLLITSHAPTSVPTLVRLTPDLRTVQRIVAKLVARVSTRVTAADVEASFACHGSNIRELLFDLYDRHEKLRR